MVLAVYKLHSKKRDFGIWFVVIAEWWWFNYKQPTKSEWNSFYSNL